MRFPYKVKDTKSIQKNFDYLVTLFTRRYKGTISTTAPSVVAGKNFSVTKLGVGQIRVTFARAFPTVPVPVCSITSASGNNVQCNSCLVTNADFVCRTPATAAVEDVFSFSIEEAT